MKVTTSPASSAFMVMMSSLSAHFSILDCGMQKRKIESGQREFFGCAGTNTGAEGGVSRGAEGPDATRIA